MNSYKFLKTPEIEPEYKNLVTTPYEFLKTIEPDAGFVYNKKIGDSVVRWIENNCSFTKGRWAGRKFKLQNWQKLFIHVFYGFSKEEENEWGEKKWIRQYENAFILVPKKNGKTELAAALVLFHLIADGEQSPNIYSIAVDEKQSGLVYQAAAKMVKFNENYFIEKEDLRVYIKPAEVRNNFNDGFYRPLSSRGIGKQGINPSLVVVDESHEFRDTKLYQSVASSAASAAREQPTNLIITTAGYDDSGLTRFLVNKGLPIQEKKVKDPLFLPVIFQAKSFSFETAFETMKRVNPNTGTILKEKTFLQRINEARINEELQEEVKAYNLNIFIERGKIESWIPEESWIKCEVEEEEAIRKIQEVFLNNKVCFGFDFGSLSDLAALVAVAYNPTDKKLYIHPHIWVTQKEIKKQQKLGVPFLEWRRKGFFEHDIMDKFDPDDLPRILNQVISLYPQGVNLFGYDPSWVKNQMIRFQKKVNFECVPINTSINNLNEAHDVFLRLLNSGRIVFAKNDLFSWCARNTYVKQNDGKVLIEKNDDNKKIDPIMATIYAIDSMLKHEKKPKRQVVASFGRKNRLLKTPFGGGR